MRLPPPVLATEMGRRSHAFPKGATACQVARPFRTGCRLSKGHDFRLESARAEFHEFRPAAQRQSASQRAGASRRRDEVGSRDNQCPHSAPRHRGMVVGSPSQGHRPIAAEIVDLSQSLRFLNFRYILSYMTAEKALSRNDLRISARFRARTPGGSHRKLLKNLKTVMSWTSPDASPAPQLDRLRATTVGCAGLRGLRWFTAPGTAGVPPAKRAGWEARE